MTTPTRSHSNFAQYEGKTYMLTAGADYTNRLLPAPYVNYAEASDGEAYDFEMSAPAVDSSGKKMTVYWMFEGVKGEDDPELDSYDYDDVARVEVAE